MTGEKRETIEVLLANRCYLYTLFHTTFGRAPDADFLRVLTDDQTGLSLGLLSREPEDMLGCVASFLSDVQSHLDEADYQEKIRDEYTRLFVGPGSLVAPPWESVYCGEDDTLFQAVTLQVRETYRSYGLLPEEYPHVADDSLALELDFLSKLAQRGLEAFRNGKEEEMQEMLSGSLRFLDEHLLHWLPGFLKRMENSTTKYLYPRMCMILDAFLKADRDILKEILTQ